MGDDSSTTSGKRKRAGSQTEIEADTGEKVEYVAAASPAKIVADGSSILDKYSTFKQMAAIAEKSDIVIVKSRHKK